MYVLANICTAKQDSNPNQIDAPKKPCAKLHKCTRSPLDSSTTRYLKADMGRESTGVGSVVTTLMLGSLSSGGSWGSCGARVLTGLV